MLACVVVSAQTVSSIKKTNPPKQIENTVENVDKIVKELPSARVSKDRNVPEQKIIQPEENPDVENFIDKNADLPQRATMKKSQ